MLYIILHSVSQNDSEWTSYSRRECLGVERLFPDIEDRGEAERSSRTDELMGPRVHSTETSAARGLLRVRERRDDLIYTLGETRGYD